MPAALLVAAASSAAAASAECGGAACGDLPFATYGHEVAGGLNNMIMNVAQLLHGVCSGGTKATHVLVLPPFNVGKNFFKKYKAPYNNESIPFSDLFDLDHFRRHVLPCRVTDRLPDGVETSRVEHVRVAQVNVRWYPKYGAIMPLVYGALQPGRLVRQPLAAALSSVVAVAGPRWSAVRSALV